MSKLVNDFCQRVVDGQSEQAALEFLQASCSFLHEAQVWPPAPDEVCGEVTTAYNYVIIKTSSLVCGYKTVSSSFGTSKTDKILNGTLNRVYKCITGSNPVDGGKAEEEIDQKLLEIVKALENPVFHFKCLTILGRLLLLVTAICMYKRQFQGFRKDIVSCLVKLTKMAGVPVLKESCHFHHCLLLGSPLPEDTKGETVKTVTVEDVVCLFLTSFDKPVNHLVMEHRAWKWLLAAMDCRNLMRGKSYSLALQKLQVVVKDCINPQHKSRLLCLLADCFFHMGCPQMSIQTYRDALQTYSRHFYILHRLSLVYQSLDLPELELESLNLCVMALADEEKREKASVPLMVVDELIWSTIPPTSDITCVSAKVTFAKRCLQLKRFTEAAEQYSGLVKMLQYEDMFLQFERHEIKQELNIAEILVEAAEVLVITRQYQDCIRLCNDTQPSISADDSMAKSNQRNGNYSTNISALDNSQTDIFNLLEDSHSGDNFHPFSSSGKKLQSSMGRSDPSTDLSTSFEKSRKRMRSDEPKSVAGVDDDDENESCNDLLMARLLLCKADALALSQGFADEVVQCLQQSVDILIRHSSSTPYSPPPQAMDTSTTPCPPHSKRQRISSDGAAVCPQSTLPCMGQSDLSKGSAESEWSRLLVNTALRMATASWKRKRFSSVINSCRVVEQLDSGNLDAAYMKTLSQSENGGLQRETLVAWLNKRGVAYLLERQELKKAIQSLEQQMSSSHDTSIESKWWHWTEQDFLALDVKCLRQLLNIHSANNNYNK